MPHPPDRVSSSGGNSCSRLNSVTSSSVRSRPALFNRAQDAVESPMRGAGMAHGPDLNRERRRARARRPARAGERSAGAGAGLGARRLRNDRLAGGHRARLLRRARSIGGPAGSRLAAAGFDRGLAAPASAAWPASRPPASPPRASRPSLAPASSSSRASRCASPPPCAAACCGPSAPGRQPGSPPRRSPSGRARLRFGAGVPQRRPRPGVPT